MTEQAFKDIIRKHVKYLKAEQTLDVDQPLRALGLDSMGSVELLLDIEDTYGISLPQKYLMGDPFSTARTVWGHIKEMQHKD